MTLGVYSDLFPDGLEESPNLMELSLQKARADRLTDSDGPLVGPIEIIEPDDDLALSL